MASWKMLAVGLYGLVIGCAAAPPVTLVSNFNPDEVAWANGPGKNTIAGSALMRTVGGEVKTCAGFEADLIPFSRLATERLSHMAPGGYGAATAMPVMPESPTDYARSIRMETCDPQGNFTFSNIPDGQYYVTAKVTWGVPLRYYTAVQGGLLTQLVTVSNGETKKVVLSR